MVSVRSTGEKKNRPNSGHAQQERCDISLYMKLWQCVIVSRVSTTTRMPTSVFDWEKWNWFQNAMISCRSICMCLCVLCHTKITWCVSFSISVSVCAYLISLADWKRRRRKRKIARYKCHPNYETLYYIVRCNRGCCCMYIVNILSACNTNIFKHLPTTNFVIQQK